MKNRLYRAYHRSLCIVLFAAIIVTFWSAIQMTHVSASVTVSFGTQPKQFAEALSTRDLLQFAALPVPAAIPARKPGVKQ